MIRYGLKLLILFLICSSLLHAQDKQPNVIVILADDMGWKDVGYHGSEIKTPTMDRLAKEGVELNRYYVHPACTPTRSAMMTGKAALRLGVVAPLYKNADKGLLLSEKIMPQYFKENNYQTWLVGKWHLGRWQKEYWPFNRGFDHFYGYLTGGVGHYDKVHGGGYDWQRNGVTVRDDGYTTHLLTNEAVTLISDRNKEAPFFLELCYAAPHLPNEAPEATIAQYAFIENKKRGVHAAMISEVDNSIQQIYETLEKEGLLENTIIWFSSDNGGLSAPPHVKKNHLAIQMAEKWGRPVPDKFNEFVRDNIENGASDNSPFKGEKRTVFEGGARVPAFVYAPGYLTAKKEESRITVNDLLPTLATAANLKGFNAVGLDGVSQWDYLTGKTNGPTVPDYVIQARGNHAIYKDDWKLVSLTGKAPQLYDIIKDPTEQNNVAADHEDLVMRLQKQIDDFPRGEPIGVPMAQKIVDPDFFGGEEDRAEWAGFEGRNIPEDSIANYNRALDERKSKGLATGYWLLLMGVSGVIGWILGRRV